MDPCRGEIAPDFGSERILVGTSDLFFYCIVKSTTSLEKTDDGEEPQGKRHPETVRKK